MSGRTVEEEVIRRWIEEHSSSPSYLVYNFSLTQASALVAPDVTIRANTFEGGLTWEREDVGVYFTITDLDYPSDVNKIYIPGQYDKGVFSHIPLYAGPGNLVAWVEVQIVDSGGKIQIYVYVYNVSEDPADLNDIFTTQVIGFPEIRIYA